MVYEFTAKGLRSEFVRLYMICCGAQGLLELKRSMMWKTQRCAAISGRAAPVALRLA